jgi:hypothetical protein
MNAPKSERLKHLSVKTPERTKTLGGLVYENAQKDHPGLVGVEELVRETSKGYEDLLLSTIAEGKKQRKGDFYVVCLIKKERLFDEVVRGIWFHRQTCPTPTYSQLVYRYQANPEKLEFLWVVPDPDTCDFYCYNALEVVPEERDLLNFILDFRAGNLDQKCRDLNGEAHLKTGIVLVNA